MLQILSIPDTESQIHGASCHIGNILETPYKSLCNPLQQAQEIDCFFKDWRNIWQASWLNHGPQHFSPTKMEFLKEKTIVECDSLRHVPYRLREGSNNRSPVGGTVWGGYRTFEEGNLAGGGTSLRAGFKCDSLVWIPIYSLSILSCCHTSLPEWTFTRLEPQAKPTPSV